MPLKALFGNPIPVGILAISQGASPIGELLWARLPCCLDTRLIWVPRLDPILFHERSIHASTDQESSPVESRLPPPISQPDAQLPQPLSPPMRVTVSASLPYRARNNPHGSCRRQPLLLLFRLANPCCHLRE